jgi:hypothetical protein
LWKTVPWEDDPGPKTAADYLLDIGTDIAEYLAQIKICDSSKGDYAPRYSQIRSQVTTSLEELNTWWQKWESKHAQSAWEVTSNRESNQLLFPTLLEFDRLWSAFEVSTYNAIRILLLQLWNRLQLVASPIEETTQKIVLDIPNGTVLLGISSDIKGLAS